MAFPSGASMVGSAAAYGGPSDSRRLGQNIGAHLAAVWNAIGGVAWRCQDARALVAASPNEEYLDSSVKRKLKV
jgi:hypothetical protein